MTDHKQDEPADRRVSPVRLARRDNRRRLAVIGTGGMAVILAGGAYFATRLSDSPQSPPETTVMAPLGTTASVEPGPGTASNTSDSAQDPAAGPDDLPAKPTSRAQPLAAAEPGNEAKPAPTEPDPDKVRKEIEEARAKAAADGVKLQRPLKQKTTAAVGAVNERTEHTADGSIRVISAKHDLSGQREMRFAGDRGKPAGKGVSCTNRMRFAEGSPVTARPTALLCWRISGKRSVVTMAVAPGGRPSRAASVAVISKEWAALG